MEIIETTAKAYEWHDLRKNPEDLPTEEGTYLVKHTQGNYQVIEWCDGWNCVRLLTGEIYKDSEMFNVIAWKEIEPFE